MEELKFSVITVTYNAAGGLERTIQSVLEQEGVEVEYLVIDGGSTDGTVDIVRRYESRIAYWVSEPDRGLYDAMNKGLEKSTGTYLLFLNAGDVFQRPDTLAGVAGVARKGGCPDVLYGETDLVDGLGRYMAPRRLKAPETLNWKSFRMGMLVCHQAFIVKREHAPLYDLSYRFSADFDWCIRCMKRAKTLVNTHLRLVYYQYEGLSTANRKASLKERYRIMQKYYGKATVFFLHFWFAFRYFRDKMQKKTV